MANYISLRGFVSSDITMSTTDSGLVIAKFRMGSNTRQQDPITNQWVDGKTNWFQVSAFRALATNAMISIHKGNRIVVTGKLKVTSYLRKDGTPGNGVDIEADSIGLDLNFGTVTYHRTPSNSQNNGASGAEHASGPVHPDIDEGEFPIRILKMLIQLTAVTTETATKLTTAVTTIAALPKGSRMVNTLTKKRGDPGRRSALLVGRARVSGGHGTMAG
ncbi:single-stranded DNA-binding protein [Arthrobacter alpinus]|nr:single-stranded DNA-binding protein [Arthrobacter alpinus]